MNRRRVFISSILDKSKEDFSEEHTRALRVIRAYPFLEPWAFEEEPASSKSLRSSYLDEVKQCDIFALIAGQNLTKPVTDEFETARASMKPILFFLRAVEERSDELKKLISDADVKYASYSTSEEFEEQFKRALDAEIARSLAAASSSPAPISSPLVTKLLRLAKEKATIRIGPIVPSTRAFDLFTTQECDLESEVLVAMKQSSMHYIHIPLGRITEVLPNGPRDPQTLVLRGRIQWLTPLEQWKFFPEEPTTQEQRSLGFAKQSGDNDMRARTVSSLILSKGAEVGFLNQDRLADYLSDGGELVYDADGLYFRKEDRPFPQLLVMKRRP